MRRISVIAAAVMSVALASCGGDDNNNPTTQGSTEKPQASTPPTKNVVFFLGDGMGMTTMTAARICKVGEDGDLTMDTLPESGFVRTYSTTPGHRQRAVDGGLHDRRQDEQRSHLDDAGDERLRRQRGTTCPAPTAPAVERQRQEAYRLFLNK